MRIGRVAVGVVVAVVALAACRPRVIVVQGMPSTSQGMPECPHSWRGHGVNLSAMVPRGIVDVPEFHDCQRLRETDEGYGPLAAVFARDSLSLFKDSDYAVPRGRTVALIYLPPTEGDYPTTYAPLGLDQRYACVIVRRTPGVDAAWIVPVADGKACDRPDLLPATADPDPDLELHVMPSPMPDREVPPVARWDWDDSTATQVVGVRCGTAWCEIGVAGFRGSAGHDPGAEAGPMRAGYALRGAYDEQRLAEWDGEGLKSAMNRGTVVPMPELLELSQKMPTAGEWIPAARVHLDPSAGVYETKFNFAASRAAPADTRAAVVSLCHGTAGAPCRPTERRTRLDVRACTTAEGDHWVARVGRPGAANRYVCVVYRKHETPGFSIPPVVRWRWRADDETIWISCPYGCCEVNAET